MTKNFYAIPAFLLGCAVLAHAQSAASAKIGIIHLQIALLNTKEGKKAAEDMNAKFAPKKAEFEKRQNEIEGKEDRLRKGSATMSDEAAGQLRRDIDTSKKNLQRDTEDAQADWDQEENKVFNELATKMYAILEKYAKENAFSVIFDVSQQQTVLWASDSINITNDIVGLYDKAYPGAGTGATGSAAPASGGAKPPAAAPSAPPAARPPTAPAPTAPKKQ